MRWLEAVDRHPRHTVLFAATAGLLLGPLPHPVTIVAAAAAAALVRASARCGGPVAVAAGDGPATDGAGAAGGGPVGTAGGVGGSPAALQAGAPGGLVLALAATLAMLAGAVVADARIAALEAGRLPGLEGRSLSARAVLLEPVRQRRGGLAVARARLLDGPAPGEGAVLRMRHAAQPGGWPGVGEIVAIAGTVAPLGVYDAYQLRRGAPAAVDVSRIRVTGERRGGLAGFVDAARRRAEKGLARGLKEPEAALLRGMVLGQDERLQEDVRDDFKRSGLAHVLAVSGQNVMLLATLVLAAGAVLGVGLRARLVLAFALVALYVPLTGAGPSIQRAGVMGAAGLVAALAGRPAHRWYALGLAAAATLAVNPGAAGEPGWQLSFAAVVALLALGPPLRGRLARALPGPAADVAAITVAATIGTAPLMAFHFGQVSLASLPANLLAAGPIALVMWLGMLAAAAAQIAPVLAEPFNALNAPLLEFVEWVARTMADLPAAVMPVRLGSPAGLAAAYAALAAAVAGARSAARRLARSRAPLRLGGSPRLDMQRPQLRWAAVATPVVAIVALLAITTPTQVAAPPVGGEVVVSFLNIGQGDATLIRTASASVLVDTGPPGGPIVTRLHEAGVKRLDGLVITHAQSDHEGMALDVMRAFRPRLVVDGGTGWRTYVQRELPDTLAATGGRRLDAHAGQTITFGTIGMRLLWPPAPAPDFRPEGDPNDRAIVALVTVGEFDLFLPADAESNVTATLPLPDVDAMKVAHHGSADDGLPSLLERLKPEVAAIEVGRGNTYGHPTPRTLGALRAVEHVYRTDRDGTVRLRVHGGAMTVERAP